MFLERQMVPRSEYAFPVVGEFTRDDARPFMHDLEHQERLRRYSSQDWEQHVRLGGVTYSYLGAYKFVGYRIDGEEAVPFETADTRFVVTVDGEFLIGVEPPENELVLGQFLEADPNYYEILSAGCFPFVTLSQEELQDLLH